MMLSFKHNFVSELLYIFILVLKVCNIFCDSYCGTQKPIEIQTLTLFIGNKDLNTIAVHWLRVQKM